MYVVSEELNLWVSEDQVTFNVCKSMKHLIYIHVVSIDDVIDEAVATMRHLMCVNEKLKVVLVNCYKANIQGYEEVLAALSGCGEGGRGVFKNSIEAGS